MELSAKDRIVLLQILPKEGNFLTFKSVRELRDKMHFSEEEIEALGMKQSEDGMLSWKPDQDVPREFSLSKAQRDLIENALVALDKEGQINEDNFTLYEKFIEG